ncbi:MAG: sigma-70 family RNA polymerase sigma factor [Novosphingobium sp.]|nr:sigma-70 family RNA polymerase sigma factor [Novosphingobium sp.]
MTGSDRGSDSDPTERFKQVLLEILPQLRAFARGLCGRRDYADDLVQETMVKAWTSREKFVPGTSMRSWTFTILRNHYISELRRSRRHREIDPETAERVLVAPAEQEGRVHLSDMDAALQKLPPERREAVVLVGAGGFTYEEAAEICDCAIGTIRSRVARGRAELARLLALESDKESAGEG